MNKIVFMGSPDFALPGLRALAQDYEVIGVITQPDRASGRGREIKMPPVKTLALELGLPVMQPEKLRAPEAMQQLLAWNPDLIVVAAFGQILKKDVLELPRFGCNDSALTTGSMSTAADQPPWRWKIAMGHPCE